MITHLDHVASIYPEKTITEKDKHTPNVHRALFTIARA